MIYIKKLPKAELHCHLDGSLSLEVIRRLADLAGQALPDSDEDLAKLVTAPSDVTSLNDYLKTFAVVLPLLQTEEALTLAAYDVARQAAEEGVIYTEIRFAPVLSMEKGLTAVQVVEAVLSGFEQAKADFGILAKVLVCGMRQLDQAESLSIFREVAHLAPRGMVGFDFAGDEENYPTHVLEETIKTAQELGLPFTLHAGECGCATNIVEGLALNIPRFGHASALTQSDDLIEQFVAAGATAELCLVSNLHTKAIKSLDEFPYQKLYALSGNITINTDNRTVSNTNLTREYELYQQHFGTTIRDFLIFNENAIRASFASEPEKSALLLALKEGYAAFLD